jgi:hypothetical protein
MKWRNTKSEFSILKPERESVNKFLVMLKNKKQKKKKKKEEKKETL